MSCALYKRQFTKEGDYSKTVRKEAYNIKSRNITEKYLYSDITIKKIKRYILGGTIYKNDEKGSR